MNLKIALLRCHSCVNQALAIVGADGEMERISESRCHRQWDTVRVFSVDVPAEFTIGEECPVHSYAEHGKEAEELRVGIEDALNQPPEWLESELRGLLDRVDARDSLAFLERKAEEPSETTKRRRLLREARNLGFVDDGKPDRSSGNVVYFLTCTRQLRRLKLQIWGDGKHRVSHSKVTWRNGLVVGECETNEPTGFNDMPGMYRAIAFEWQRESRKP